MSAAEVALTGGEVNEVVRVGDTVRRTSGAWTPSVQRVLAHLRAAGFAYAPGPLGLDERGREVLEYLPGVPAARPWPEVLLCDDGVHRVARMVAELGAALRSYDVREDDLWRHGGVPGSDTSTLRHGDLGLWNTIWSGETLVGLIDWDYLEPAPERWDFAQLCWYVAPLPPNRWQDCGFAEEPDWRRRLAIVASYADARVQDLAAVLLELQALDRRRTTEWGSAGVHPWDLFLHQGYVADIDAGTAWLRAHLLGRA